MLSRRSALVAAVASALALFVTGSADAAPKHAKTKGAFDVADANTTGQMMGPLKNKAGNTVLLLQATLTDATPSGAGGVAGTIDGVLKNPNTGNVVAQVKGKYKGGPNGNGKFKLVALKQNQAGVTKKIGVVKGHWHDASPVGTAGGYKGKAAFK